jgi:hypothetical protein
MQKKSNQLNLFYQADIEAAKGILRKEIEVIPDPVRVNKFDAERKKSKKNDKKWIYEFTAKNAFTAVVFTAELLADNEKEFHKKFNKVYILSRLIGITGIYKNENPRGKNLFKSATSA